MSSSRQMTPPPQSAESSRNMTADQVRRVELNRLKAKARLREREATREGPSSSRNPNNKRPLEVIPATSKSPTKPGAPEAPKPLRRDNRFGNYYEYDLSKMVNSKGGFLLEENSKADERTKMLEKQRAEQRTAQKFDPPVFLDPKLNPKCVECGSIDIDQTFKRIFGILVCEKCKTAHPEKYSLLTKTECKEDYLLTDPELRDGEILPHLLKANPHKSTWNNMMLFVRSQVEEFAFKKWGGAEGLDAEWTRRSEDAKKRKGRKFAQGLKDLRRKTREGTLDKRKDEEHVHSFGALERLDDGSGMSLQRCVNCGFEIEFEEM